MTNTNTMPLNITITMWNQMATVRISFTKTH